ncbi:MAG: NAD-dependent epimerase/dehydratase family protein [Clostridiales bacterium]|nr:NAD-dependent epimerase/dehydratase family protein [Clostridiales bacterium]
MRALFIGGTGTISSAITRKLAQDNTWEVWLINRGSRADTVPENVHQIVCNINDEEEVTKALEGMTFDVVGEFIGFTVDQVERDYRLFKDITRQYIYISSASAYNKPSANYIITEGTSLANPYWEYSRNKIACEQYLMERYREDGFPVTIVRPSHTYDERNIPLGVHGKNGSWQVVKRMMDGKPVIIHGDGESLWHLTFNEDFAIGYTALMGNRHAIGEAFQITGDEVLTWNQIYQTIADALGVELKAYHVSSELLTALGPDYDFKGSLTGDKAVSVVFDNSKIKRLAPDLKTNVPFHKGVRRALNYILDHEECRREDPEFDKWCDKVIETLEKAKKDF